MKIKKKNEEQNQLLVEFCYHYHHFISLIRRLILLTGLLNRFPAMVALMVADFYSLAWP